jgi:hypothetical protein
MIASVNTSALIKTSPFAPHALDTQKQAIQNAFRSWITAMCSGNTNSIMQLYVENAILLPTFSPKVHHSSAMRQTYFEAISLLNNLKITVQEQYIRLFGTFAINSGMYTFSHNTNGVHTVVPARFTFAYEETDCGWLIVEHHSSQLKI